MKKPTIGHYLGDGLYLSFDGYQIRLFAERDGGTHEVFMDEHVVHTFLEVLGRVWNIRIEIKSLGDDAP